MNLFQYIKQNYSKLTSREKLIADYLLNEKIQILSLSAKQIGILTKTSAPTVIRFSKKLGFNNLNEMKLKLSLSLQEENSENRFEYLDKTLSTSDIVNNVKNSLQCAINSTINLIQIEELQTAIDLLVKANNIYIYGIGNSGIVGMDFYHKLSRIGKKCTWNCDSHLQITSSILMEKNDVAFIISYSGETREMLLCAENAKQRNVKIISITKASVNNMLSKISDITLRVPYIEKSLREGAMGSRMSQLTLIDILFIGIARNNSSDIEDKLILTRDIIKKLKT